MPITAVFDPPLPSDSPPAFNLKAFATIGALNTWSTQANALAVEVNQDETTLNAAVSSASGSATTATTKAGEASTSATTATTQAGIATTQATNASNSAAAALASLNDFKGRYYGPLAANPTLDPLGAAMGSGDAYWNTASSELRIYNGSAWVAPTALASASQTAAATSATNAATSATNAANSATAASGSATTATTKAGEASTSATTASTQAGIATTKAGEASASATTASGSATTATTQAGIATTKAGEAAASALAADASADAAAASVASIAGGPVASVNGRTGVVTGVQDLLVSGTSIKTVNSTSLLGAGDITTVTSVTGTAPIVSSGGTAPAISISAATTGAAGSMSSADKSKLDGIAESANNYTHPVNHPPSIITQDADNRFVTDTEKATWNAKQPAGSYQALDADLTAIAALAGTSGLLKKTAADTWALDTAAYTTNLGDVTLTGTQTLTNKTLTGYTETQYNLTGTDLAVSNGTVQYKTLSANTTFTESLADGQGVILMLNPSTYTTTWPTATWIGTAASTAPTLIASVYNCLVFFQMNGTLYGRYAGRV